METVTVCDFCSRLIPGAVDVSGPVVILKKVCPDRTCAGSVPRSVLLASDTNYFMRCWTDALALPVVAGSGERPYNMCILEITNECDIECTTCIARAGPGRGRAKTFEQCERLLEAVIRRKHVPDLMVLSGGEPCIHPEFEAILRSAVSFAFPHVMVISNGIKLAEDEALVERLGAYGDRVEIYLQFDSLSASSLEDLRGRDLTDVRLGALRNLERYSVPTTLVCVVKKGVNDSEVCAIVQKALKYRNVRGVTFQPIRSTGRHSNFDMDQHRVHLAEVRNLMNGEGGLFGPDGIIPHPRNPLGAAIGYLHRERGRVRCVTQELFKACEEVTPTKGCPPFKESMFFLPAHRADGFAYENLFRVAIVCFLDVLCFMREQLNSSNLAFVNEAGELVPFDTYYLDGEARWRTRI